MTATLLSLSHWSSLTIAARSAAAAALLCTSHAACSGAHSSRSEKRTTQRAYLRALNTADMLPTGETRELVRWTRCRSYEEGASSRGANRLFTYEDVIRLPVVNNSRSRGYASSFFISFFKGVGHSWLYWQYFIVFAHHLRTWCFSVRPPQEGIGWTRDLLRSVHYSLPSLKGVYFYLCVAFV